MKLKIKFGDILIIAAIIFSSAIIAVSLYEEDSEQRMAIISQNNVVLYTIDLNQHPEPYTLSYSSQYSGTIEVNNGKIRFLKTQCPDQICVHTGWIERPGEIAVCLPSRVLIKIEGSTQSDVDIILK